MPDTSLSSPFHAGEQLTQTRVGVRDEIEQRAQTTIRDFMPDQHRAFFGMLPFVLVGTTDGEGRPWASIVIGQPGFVTTPDEKTIQIAASLLVGDPLNETLEAGADVGLLGIQLETRRRNRLTGTIQSVTSDGRADGITIALSQSFGNCPKYIQTRTVQMPSSAEAGGAAPNVVTSDRFDEQARALITAADTLFIATTYRGDGNDASNGADVSHRGGKPGFVHIENDRTFVLPDFAGNNYFNTIGNIVMNPRAGFLFVDFDRSDLLYMTGHAEIVWNGPAVEAIGGAERLIRFRAEEIVQVSNSLGLTFQFGGFSPSLKRTGTWPET